MNAILADVVLLSRRSQAHGEIALIFAMFLPYFLVIKLRCSVILTFTGRA